MVGVHWNWIGHGFHIDISDQFPYVRVRFSISQSYRIVVFFSFSLVLFSVCFLFALAENVCQVRIAWQSTHSTNFFRSSNQFDSFCALRGHIGFVPNNRRHRNWLSLPQISQLAAAFSLLPMKNQLQLAIAIAEADYDRKIKASKFPRRKSVEKKKIYWKNHIIFLRVLCAEMCPRKFNYKPTLSIFPIKRGSAEAFTVSYNFIWFVSVLKTLSFSMESKQKWFETKKQWYQENKKQPSTRFDCRRFWASHWNRTRSWDKTNQNERKNINNN